MARPAHAKAHADCPNGVTSWDACDRAVRERMGPCQASTEKGEPCSNLAASVYGDLGYCGQHYGSVVERSKRQEKERAHRDALLVRIDAALAWREGHPSVWDQMPEGWRPGEPLRANPAKVSLIWSASSGAPPPAGRSTR